MNRWRILGLVILTALLTWLAVRSLLPDTPPPPPPPQPVREPFHPAKPLQVIVQTAGDSAAASITGPAWLDRELRHLLQRGKLNVAAPPVAQATDAAANVFSLRVTQSAEGTRAELELIAPDSIVDKRADIELPQDSSLATMQALARQLAVFLGAPSDAADWSAALGTTDAAAYEAFLRSADDWLGSDAAGFTAPPAATSDTTLKLERLETLSRRHREFARARALLSLAYLGVGGEDETSLTKLAETAAERALSADAELADARAALGIVGLRRMDWSAAQEHFAAALALDAGSIAALEGLGCLLMDAGHVRGALPVAMRAAALQPGNRGASECATYARIATQTDTLGREVETAETARIHAMMLLLTGDSTGADELLRSSGADADGLARSVVAAGGSRAKIPAALQAVTTSADDEAIDAETEILFGVALKRADFVFNRMLRLAKQNEAVPLRVLWLPQTEFLRKHRRFKEVVSAATLTTYWQDNGVPDICASEPKVHGCAAQPK